MRISAHTNTRSVAVIHLVARWPPSLVHLGLGLVIAAAHAALAVRAWLHDSINIKNSTSRSGSVPFIHESRNGTTGTHNRKTTGTRHAG
ncbi:hypothetical protein AY555_06855 [Haematospirillum jordaniae]|uniref:Uncharacterized protein n=1 Tax=Haematospirillum jordaniae TaxID=1549855 RepID=A0A143DFR9_9PROT|nr:hypothetical protein AY555_06855 [Haematospirillum jordaniae]